MVTKKKKTSSSSSSVKKATKNNEKKIVISRDPLKDLMGFISGGDKTLEAISFSSDDIIGHVKSVTSTMSIAIDKMTGLGGMPDGRMIEISGREQVGKTTLIQSIALATQLKGGVVGLYDTEEKVDKNYCASMGLDTKKILAIQPVYENSADEDDDGEDSEEADTKRANKKEKKKKEAVKGSKTFRAGILAMDRALQGWIDSGNAERKIPLTLIWDSVGGTPTDEELSDPTSKEPSVASRWLRRMCRIITSKLARAGALLVLVNQTYEVINGFGFGPKTKTYGGGGIRYHSSMRFEMIRTGALTHTNGTNLGITGIIKLTKNSLGAENSTTYAIAHGRGFDNAWSILEKLKEAKYIVVKAGGNYTFQVVGEPPIIWKGGFAQLDLMMRENPEFKAKLYAIYNALP